MKTYKKKTQQFNMLFFVKIYSLNFNKNEFKQIEPISQNFLNKKQHITRTEFSDANAS